MEKMRLTYHWTIVAACFLLMAVSIGIIINCFNPLSVELIKEFGSAGSVQLILTIAVLSNLIGGALVGKIMAKFSMRVAMPVYAAIMSAGLIMYAYCGSLNMFYIASLFVGFGASGISLVPCGALINNWFEEKKGLATGIAFTGSVAGGLIFVQLTKILLATADWQAVYMALGIIAAVVAIPITIFIVREHPRDKGLLPFGAKEAAGSAAGVLKGVSLKKYIKTGSFWLLAISVFIIGFTNMGLQNNISIYLTSIKGHTESVAANIFSLYLFVQIFGKIILGAIYDKKGIKFGAIYCMTAFIISVALLIYSGNLYIAIAFAAVFALVGSMTTVTPPYVTATIVGLKDYPTIFGVLSLFYGIGVATGPVIAARVYDSTGSYDQAWIAFGILAVIIVFTTVLAAKKGEGLSQI